jgi:ADP-L-glycero-D-manno-heptose 6-epimerase
MIVVTGGTGLVGSNLVKVLNRVGREDIVVVDSVGETEKWRNLEGTRIVDFINYKQGAGQIHAATQAMPLQAIFHIGANADVLNRDADRMLDDNLEHSKAWFRIAQAHGVPMYYASSSAVYGNSPQCHAKTECERPHNPYAFSKWLFDRFVSEALLSGLKAPVIGFRLFNVFGLGEEHKGKNASLPRRFMGFLREQGRIDLFQDDIQRDYVPVEGVCAVFLDAWKNARPSQIVNLGAGRPITHREVAELAVAAARAAGIRVENEGIALIPMPEELRGSFQFRTCAEGVPDWIQAHVSCNREWMKIYMNLLAAGWQRSARFPSSKPLSVGPTQSQTRFAKLARPTR